MKARVSNALKLGRAVVMVPWLNFLKLHQTHVMWNVCDRVKLILP
jgi:hypothetical protein